MSTSNPDRTPVAQDIFTYCTRERTDTWHVVRNHNALGFVDRVICKSCSSEHKYKSKTASALLSPRSGAVVLKRGASTSSSSAAKSAKSSELLEDSWLLGLKKWGDKQVINFDPARPFKSGEVLLHSVFGKGVVQSRRENKIDVLFKEGLKTLPSKAV